MNTGPQTTPTNTTNHTFQPISSGTVDHAPYPITTTTDKPKATVPLLIICIILFFGVISSYAWRISESSPEPESTTTAAVNTAIYNNNCVTTKDLLKNHDFAENESINIGINPPTELNYKTKQEILNQRKTYVENSANKSVIFCPSNQYEPSEYAYGQIVDHKPWMNLAQTCNEEGLRGTQGGIDGVSEESMLLNNPYALIGLETMFWTDADCSKDRWILPAALQYYPTDNLMELDYYWDTVKILFGNRILLNGLNAIDMGYSWVQVLESGEVEFSSSSIIDQPYQLRNFIHLGSSCAIDGGCNNSSPYQSQLEFTIKCGNSCGQHVNYPYITFGLWHEQPNTNSEDPDLYFVLRFTNNTALLTRDSK